MDAFKSDPWGSYLIDEEPDLVLFAPSALRRFRRMLAVGSLLRIVGAGLGGGALVLLGMAVTSTDLMATGLSTLGTVLVLGGAGITATGAGTSLQTWARAALPRPK